MKKKKKKKNETSSAANMLGAVMTDTLWVNSADD